MDKIMAALQAGFAKFFDWWGNLTGLGTSTYDHWPYSVNWKVISPMIILIVLAVLFLPTGIVDSFIFSYK